MGVISLPKTITEQRRGCDLNPGPSAPESSTLTTRLPITRSHRIACFCSKIRNAQIMLQSRPGFLAHSVIIRYAYFRESRINNARRETKEEK